MKGQKPNDKYKPIKLSGAEREGRVLFYFIFFSSKYSIYYLILHN